MVQSCCSPVLLGAGPALAETRRPAAAGAVAGRRPPRPRPTSRREAVTLSAKPGDPFGEEVTYAERPLLSVKGGAGWENGFETLQKAFRTVNAALAARNLKAAGPPTVVYLRADDAGFDFEAGVPLAATPPPPAVAEEPTVRPTPSGRAFRFTHRGAFDTMDRTYDVMTNYLDEKRVDVRDLYVEEYLTDPLTTPEDELKVLIYVFPELTRRRNTSRRPVETQPAGSWRDVAVFGASGRRTGRGPAGRARNSPSPTTVWRRQRCWSTWSRSTAR